MRVFPRSVTNKARLPHIATRLSKNYRNLFNERHFMQESTSAAIDEAAAIIRAILIRILSGKSDKSPEVRDRRLDISEIHA